MSTIQTQRKGELVSLEALDENGHRFVLGKDVGFREESVLHKARCCFDCGIIRRADGQNKPCRGPVKVQPR